MKVSIIIPIYNVASYIVQCLDSVYHQTYQDLEVILVDDCGTDDSMGIINQYLTLDKQKITRIVHHDKNKGLSAARNTGIKVATGHYLYFLDSDDYLSNDCIESFINLASEYKPNIVFGCTEPVPYNWTNVTLDVNRVDIPLYWDDKYKIAKSLLKKNYLPVTAWNKLVDRNYVVENELYFKEGISYEDEYWNWMIANSVQSIAFNKNITYYYRCNPSGIMHRYGFREMDSEVLIIRGFLSNLKLGLLRNQFAYILKFAHTACCKRYFRKELPPVYVRYPKALFFMIKCLIYKAERLRV